MTAPVCTARLPSRRGRRALYDYLAVLTGCGDEGLLELRYRLDGQRLARRFYPARRPAGLVEAITWLGSRGDVLGCAPRARRAGGRDAIENAYMAWVGALAHPGDVEVEVTTRHDGLLGSAISEAQTGDVADLD